MYFGWRPVFSLHNSVIVSQEKNSSIEKSYFLSKTLFPVRFIGLEVIKQEIYIYFETEVI
jgi:hypothetical protein